MTQEQYASWLDGRSDLLWPAVPRSDPPRAQPYLRRIPGIRVVTFSIYGTLVRISGGELSFLHPEKFMMEAALEKTIQEFKMWPAMSRKPGKPSEYLGRMYEQILDEVRAARSSGSERSPEVRADNVWERIVKRLMKNDYAFDVNFYGSLNQFCEKISYFFHSSLQAVGPQAGAFPSLEALRGRGVTLGLAADGQAFTPVQLLRALRQQGKLADLTQFFDPELVCLSCEVGAKKPSEQLYHALMKQLAPRGIGPNEVLHVGSNLRNDVVPAKRLGLHTALFAGDRSSLVASNDQLNEKSSRPDALVTELGQVTEVVGPPR